MLLAATRIHNGKKWLPDGSVVEVGEDGVIVAIHDSSLKEQATFYEGILAPGFVNVHCHLELSHTKGLIPQHTGLIPFLQQVTQHRNDFTEEQKKAARHTAYQQLIANGIVAVGDIANSYDTADLRQNCQLHIHTFVESIGFTNTHADKRMEYATQLHDVFAAQATGDKIIRQSIVPHAPYSVSEALFKLIDAHNKKAIISIHNQESEAENEYYQHKQGAVNDLLAALDVDAGFFMPSGTTSLQTYLNWLSPTHPVIFVHNTFSTEEDIVFAMNKIPNPYWCLCPNANIYIENKLPDIAALQRHNATICIGTDSLASNNQLSVLAELHTLKQHYPSLDWETLLQWATYNGACALNMQHQIGSIEVGKKPGIVCIKGDVVRVV